MTSQSSEPEEGERRSYMLPALIGAFVFGAIILGIGAAVTRSGDDGAGDAAEQTSIVQELKDAGYARVKEAKRHSDELKRDVVDETWERSEEPQQVITTDDSSYTTKGVLIVNAVNFRGTDGKGNLSCQPDPEHSRSNLKAIIADANGVRAGIADGSLQPVKDQGGGFPYHGDFMGCLP